MLEDSVQKLHDHPSVTGVQLLRFRQEALEEKTWTAHALHEKALPSDPQVEDLTTLVRLQVQLKRIEDMGEVITQCDGQASQRGQVEEGVQTEKLSLPKFFCDPWQYT